MVEVECPMKLWDHSLELKVNILSRTAQNHLDINGQVPETIITCQTADISPYVEHGFYDWVMAFDQTQGYPNQKEILGRWLGPAHNVGPEICSKTLKSNSQILYTSMYRTLMEAELKDPKHAKRHQLYDLMVHEKLGEPTTEAKIKTIDKEAITPTYERYENQLPVPDIDDATPEYQDEYIGAEVTLPFQGTMTAGKVKKQTWTKAGEIFGKAHKNPILDSRQYNMDFPDGMVMPYTANIIAQNMITQCDAEGTLSNSLSLSPDTRPMGQKCSMLIDSSRRVAMFTSGRRPKAGIPAHNQKMGQHHGRV